MNLGKNRRDAGGPADPSNPAIAKARDQVARADADGAAATLRQLLKTPDLPVATRIEAAKIMGTAGATPDAIGIYLDAGRKALDAGDVATARSSFAAAHTLDQKGYDALFELGRVDLAEGRKDAALEKFVEVLRKSNLRHLPALYEAAVLYEGDGQIDQAVAAYKKIAERDRHHVPTLSRLADLYRKKGLLGDSLGYYLQGARAAMQSMQYREARRLVDNALQIEDDNWEARRLQTEIAKADPGGDKAPEPAPAQPAPAAQARPAAPPAPKPAAVAPPPARSAPAPAAPRPVAPAAASATPKITAAPPPASPRIPPTDEPVAPAATPAVARVEATPSVQPSTATADLGNDMDTDLPAEVTLLEKQSEVTSRLAAIMAEVAEASKKRVAIERDIKAAQAALEALTSQKSTVESSISDLTSQLGAVSAAKAAEDKELAELRAKLQAQRADLEKLAALPQFIADVQAKSTSVASTMSNATASVDAAQKRVAEATANASAVEKTASELMTRIAAARQQADEAQEQLKGVLAEAKSAKNDATAAAAAVVELKTALGSLQQVKAQVDAARNDLTKLAPAIEAKRAQAGAAVAQLDEKKAGRDAQLQAAQAQVGSASSGGNGAAPQVTVAKTPPPSVQARPAPAPSPVPAPKGKVEPKVDIDALVVAGRLDEAVRAAREGANGSADPDARIIDAAERLRETGNAAAAAKTYEKLVSAGNSSATVRYCLALAYVDLKRFKEAAPMFEALSDPEYGVLRENGIGLCLRGLGRGDEAAQHFSKALEIPGQPDGQYRDVLYNLADLYENRGDQESLNLALWSFEEIQAGAPDYRDVGDRIAALKEQLSKIEVPEPNPVLTRDGRGGRDNRF
jgi:tetratricopeptide (TPR) repeat protein